MKVGINKDTFYPCYFLHIDPAGLEFLPNFEIPDELFKQWQKCNLEFAEIQSKIAHIYESKLTREDDSAAQGGKR